MKLPPSLESSWDEIKSNRRLYWGLFLILILALVYIALIFDETLDANIKRHNDLTRSYKDAVVVEPISVWQGRVAELDGIRASFLDRVWVTETAGLASAVIQAELNKMVEASELERVDIKVGVPQEIGAVPNIVVFNVKIRASFDKDNVLDLLETLEMHRKLFVVDELVSVRGRKNNRLEMMLQVYVSLSGEKR